VAALALARSARQRGGGTTPFRFVFKDGVFRAAPAS
jgi:hypothetical protein